MKAQEQTLEGSLGFRILNVWSLTQSRKLGAGILAFAVGATMWKMPVPARLDETAWHFLVSLGVAILLWMFEVFDDYIVALMLLFSWLTIEKLPPDIALSGFASSEWFFVLAALAIAVAVTKAGLMRRVALVLLNRIPANFTFYNFILSFAGLLVTPVLPNVKGRMAIAAPVTQGISESLEFRPRSNPSAALALSTYVGFSQMSFMFLTGMSSNLIGWNLMPGAARDQFGWGVWTLAALPAGVFTFVFLVFAIRFCFPQESSELLTRADPFEAQLRSLGPVTVSEWISALAITLAVSGWLTKSMHGIGEAWIGLGCLLILLVSGVLEKEDVKRSIDWTFMIFFGVISSLGAIIRHFKLEHWIMECLTPVLKSFSNSSEIFLLVVLLLVYLVRIILHKAPVMVIFMVGLVPWAESLQIHPGALLITILLGIECWFLPYQTDSYLIAYSSSGGNAFSHGQGRKVMLLKFFASFIALLISIPYWKALGLIE